MALVSTSQRQPPAAPASGLPAGPLRRLTFPALGTTCEVQYATPDAARGTQFEQAAVAWVQAFEAKYSRFRPDSLVSRINAAAGVDWVDVDPEMEQMLQLCETLHFMTQGVLDATALPPAGIRDTRDTPKTMSVPACVNRTGTLATAWRLRLRTTARIVTSSPTYG